MSRHKQKQISILVRLILLAICTIYLIIDSRNSRITHGTTDMLEDTVSSVNNTSKFTKTMELSCEEWVENRYENYKNNIEYYTKPTEEIKIKIYDIEIPKYIKLDELESYNIYTKGLESDIYAFEEAYGEILRYKDMVISYQYKNVNSSTEKAKNCYLSSYSLSDNTEIEVGNDIIKLGESITDIIGTLNKYEFNIGEGVNNTEYENKLSMNSNNWRLTIQSSEETNIGITICSYDLIGNKQDGLKTISYNLEVITKESLEDIYNKIST